MKAKPPMTLKMKTLKKKKRIELKITRICLLRYNMTTKLVLPSTWRINIIIKMKNHLFSGSMVVKLTIDILNLKLKIILILKKLILQCLCCPSHNILIC